jgi:hypothetical protein
MTLATPALAKETWEATGKPSCRRLEEKLKAAGYSGPGYKTLATWIKSGFTVESKGEPKPKPKPRPRPEPKPKPATERPKQDVPKRPAMRLDDASPVITGDPKTTAEDIVTGAHEPRQLPPPNGEPDDRADIRARLKAVRDAIAGSDGTEPTDEALLSMAARQALKSAIVIHSVLAELAPSLIQTAPEAVGKLQLAVAQSLEAAGVPYDRIGAARERAMKTISADGMEVIPPGGEDPLADAISAYKKQHVA